MSVEICSVGNVVRVKDNLVVGEVYDGCRFVEPMKCRCGSIGIIRSSHIAADGSCYYMIEFDGIVDDWHWSKGMLTSVTEGGLINWEDTVLIDRLDDVIDTMWFNDPVADDYETRGDYKLYLLSKPVEIVKHRLSKAEVDVLSVLSDGNKKISYYAIFRNLFDIGWFTGIVDYNNTVNEILSNYILIDGDNND